MNVLEAYTYFVLPALLLAIGFGAVWLSKGHQAR
jgi:hypothetical protein